jgi:Tfp pilus assembly protein PilN
MALSFIQAGIAGFALAGAVATATWTIKQDHIAHINQRLEACERASELSYPELVDNINSASTSLAAHLDTLATVDAQTIEIKQLKQDLDLLQQEAHTAKDRFEAEKTEIEKELRGIADAERRRAEDVRAASDRLKEELAFVYAENATATLQPGQGVSFAGATVSVGFSGASSENVCFISINGSHSEMRAGDIARIESLGRSCKVILEACKHGYTEPAKVRFICSAK